jgi:hypothetical protein
MKIALRGTQALMAIFAMMLLAAAAQAETWYLMAADPDVISQPQAANMMSKGSMVGPVHFISQGEFNRRGECETDRHKLVHDWRRHSIIARGGWAKHGINNPNAFAQCVSDTDPRLAKSAAPGDVKTGPTMDILLHARRRP